MQDDFNSAPTPAGLPTPPPAQRPAQPPGSPPGSPPGHAPVWGQRSPDQTVTYYGPVDMDQPTVAMSPQPSVTWPDPGQTTPAAPPPPARQPQLSGPPIYQPGYVPAPLPAPLAPRQPQRASAPHAQPRIAAPVAVYAPSRPARRGRWAAWIPLPHALLVVGVGLLYVATLLPWAVDSSGSLITLQTASIPALSGQGGDGTALQVAYNLIGAVGVLSAGLLFFNVILRGLNKLLGGGCLAGCAIVPLYPILLALIGGLVVAQVLAAGFGGMGALGQIPVAQSYGLGGLGAAHYEPGYYVWYTGIIVNVVGMLGEFAVGRG